MVPELAIQDKYVNIGRNGRNEMPTLPMQELWPSLPLVLHLWRSSPEKRAWPTL